jgi:hypothetical protein
MGFLIGIDTVQCAMNSALTSSNACHMLVSNKTDTKAINYFRTTQTVRTTGMPDPPAEINFNWPFAIKLNV